MSMHVGSVDIEYLEYPGDAPTKFLWYVASNPSMYDWEVWSDGNHFVEYTYDRAIERSWEYTKSENVGVNEAHQVFRWIRGLPWKREVVMLHLSW